MVEKDKLSFHASRHMTAITFLIIGIITTGILFVFTFVLNQNQTAMAQQQPNGNSFQMDNMTFSHHTASVNGIQLHYVIGGHGDPVVLLH
ncbi:MAG: alpha/beta fold hydrolase, partial [Nitrososphaeraceae archaeon]